MACIVPNFSTEIANKEDANEGERLLDILMQQEAGLEETPEHYLTSVQHIFDQATPDNIQQEVFEAISREDNTKRPQKQQIQSLYGGATVH